MEIEVIFHTSSTLKKMKNVKAVYTKGALLCVELDDGLIIKYPLLNIFSVAHYHGPHLGTTKKNALVRNNITWEEVKKELKPLALAIKGSTIEEFPADLVNLEDWFFELLYNQSYAI